MCITEQTWQYYQKNENALVNHVYGEVHVKNANQSRKHIVCIKQPRKSLVGLMGILLANHLKICSHKTKNFKCFLFYVHLLTYQNTTFTKLWKIEAVFQFFIAPYLIHHSVIFWNNPTMH